MVEFLIELLLVVRSRLKSRARLEAEILVLRQQVTVLSAIPHASPRRNRSSPCGERAPSFFQIG